MSFNLFRGSLMGQAQPSVLGIQRQCCFSRSLEFNKVTLIGLEIVVSIVILENKF